MTMIVIFGDEMVTDRHCELMYPHAIGSHVLRKKLRVAQNKSFAFACAGDTLSEREQAILEQILIDTFKQPEQCVMALTHQEWFENRNLSILVMTKQANYFMPSLDSKEDSAFLSNDIKRLKGHNLVQFDSEIPASYGTGSTVASMALLEGISMKELTSVVVDVINTVSLEYDYVHRKTLKRMPK